MISKKRHRNKKRDYVTRKKRETGCQVCRWNGCEKALDLHHVDPSEKSGNFNKIISNGSIKAMEDELEKCVVLCANCHRLVHANEIELRYNKRKKTITASPVL
jgi:predicted HNH restriction endonuclease